MVLRRGRLVLRGDSERPFAYLPRSATETKFIIPTRDTAANAPLPSPGTVVWDQSNPSPTAAGPTFFSNWPTRVNRRVRVAAGEDEEAASEDLG